MSTDVKNYIGKCRPRLENSTNRSEPLMSTAPPLRPWQEIAADFAEVNGKTLLFVVDYLSSYSEVMEVK